MKKFYSLLVLFVMQCTYATAKPKVDVDLTKFNSMMAYSGVFNILSAPDKYIGKIIKLRGQFDFYHDPEDGNYYFGVNIMDYSACCAVGLDFVLRGEHQFPKDYPELGAIITVTGKFETYKEGDDLFCRLTDAEIIR